VDKVEIGTATLYHGDCLEILKTHAPVDAVITDPPYGLQENANRVASRENLAKNNRLRIIRLGRQTGHLKPVSRLQAFR